MTRPESFVHLDSDFRLALEPYRDYHFVHLDFYNYNRRSRAEFERVLNVLIEERVTMKVFVAFGNHKLQKFCRMFGWYATGWDTSPHDGHTYLIFERF